MKWRDWDINLKVRLLGEGVYNLLFWMYFPFMAIYFADAFGKQTAGYLLVASQVAGVIAGLVGGYCADHFGRKWMMVFSAIGQTICFVFFTLANSPILTSRFLTFVSFSALGMFGQLYWPASHAMIADLVPEKQRAAVFSVFYTSINVSVVIGPLLGGIFFFKYRFLFLAVCTVASAALVIILQRWIHETRVTNREENGQAKKGNWLGYVMKELADYRLIFHDKIFLVFIVAGVLVAQTSMQLDLLFPVYITEFIQKQTLFSFGSWSLVIGSKETYSWIVALNGFLVAMLTVLVTKWMQHYKERAVFIIASCFYGISVIVFGNTLNIWVMFLAIIFYTAGELMTVGIQDGFVARLAPKQMRAQYFAASSLRFSLGRTIAPLAIPMTVWIGYEPTFIILSVLAFLSAGLYGVMFTLFEKKMQRTADFSPFH